MLEVRRGADLVAALGQAVSPLHLHPPGSCTTPGPASPQVSAPASTQRSRGCVAPAAVCNRVEMCLTSPHLDAVAGGVDKLVDCEQTGVPVADPGDLGKQ